jgi:hypothetical protein
MLENANKIFVVFSSIDPKKKKNPQKLAQGEYHLSTFLFGPILPAKCTIFDP